MIIRCSCKHPGQDKLNGKQKRVCNEKAYAGTYTCTVCGREHKREGR